MYGNVIRLSFVYRIFALRNWAVAAAAEVSDGIECDESKMLFGSLAGYLYKSCVFAAFP